MSVEDKIIGMIGMANRAGKIQSGEFSVEKAVKSFKAELVIVAEDASDNTRKLFRDKCEFYEVPCYVFGTREKLGKILGKAERASVAVLDPGFAKAISDKLESRTASDK